MSHSRPNRFALAERAVHCRHEFPRPSVTDLTIGAWHYGNCPLCQSRVRWQDGGPAEVAPPLYG